MNYTDIISTVGVFLILLAFFLHTFKYLPDNCKLYFILNLIGGAFACYGSVLLGSWPFIVLEGTWSVVALVGLIKTFIERR
ncbi:MAG: hypothetical protein H7141_08550 [Burkholderiales bacterium]|nr:hypothetical protein [Bacteroidia bacterium]